MITYLKKMEEIAKVDDDQEAAKIKELMEISPDEEEVAIDAIPLTTKPPTIRGYNVSLPHNKIPDVLSQLTKKMAALEMLVGEDFQSEAAIVNYFRLGDKLGGHLDDMKVDWSKPIGAKLFFYLEGSPDEPLAMFLCTGMIVLMSGEAKEHFHEHAEMGSLEKQLSDKDDISYLEYIKTSKN
ncbi:oxoglutarate/iron-dependent dioxygenase [Tanacetum coccineum]